LKTRKLLWHDFAPGYTGVSSICSGKGCAPGAKDCLLFLILYLVHMEIYIGCSGFCYDDWKNNFYPGNLSKNHWLEYYAIHFNSVEINHTFYAYPREEILKRWMDKTPEDFRFSIKAHRFFLI
jgi:hypothetical protein